MSTEDDSAIIPGLGFSASDWARLLSHKLTSANPRSSAEAQKIYAELFGAAVRAERDACAAIADGWNEGYSPTGKDIARHIRSRHGGDGARASASVVHADGGYLIVGESAEQFIANLKLGTVEAADRRFYEDLLKSPLSGSIRTYPDSDEPNRKGIYETCRRLEEVGLLSSRPALQPHQQDGGRVIMFFVIEMMEGKTDAASS